MSDSPSGSDPDSTPSGAGGSLRPVLGVLALLALALAWFVRPWLHGLIYGLYTTPVMVVPVVLAVIAAWAYREFAPSGTSVEEFTNGGEEVELSPFRVAVLVLFLAAMVVSPVANVIEGATMSDQTLAETAETDALADVDAEQPRIVPRAVAERYAANTLNRPQYRTADTDISVVNGTPYWAAPLAPDGLFNYLTKGQGGTVLVDMTTQQANVRTVDGEMAKGVGTVVTRNYRWHLLKNGNYLADYGDPKMVVQDGEQYIAVPYSTPTFHLAPVPHATPEWGGVALIDAAGNVEDLTPAEAANHSVLAEQQLYPEDLARRKVAATKYRNGIVNTFTAHEDEIEVAPVPGENNEQPFFVLSEEGPQYVVAVEPYGEAQGLREVWTIDGQTGAFEVYRPEDSLFGPAKAADLVRQSATQTDWDRFDPAEPILTVIDDREYWQVRVVPEDNSGVAYVAFVDARTSDVREFEDTAAIRQFLAGATPGADGPGDAPGEAPSLVVQRVAPNGTVLETLEVYGNETVQVVQGDAAANASANATE
jgi:hypothetical protein